MAGAIRGGYRKLNLAGGEAVRWRRQLFAARRNEKGLRLIQDRKSQRPFDVTESNSRPIATVASLREERYPGGARHSLLVVTAHENKLVHPPELHASKFDSVLV